MIVEKYVYKYFELVAIKSWEPPKNFCKIPCKNLGLVLILSELNDLFGFCHLSRLVHFVELILWS